MIALLIFCGVGAFLFLAVYFSKRRRILRAMRKVPVTLIGHVVDRSIVRVTGRLGYTTDPLRAPLTGRTCALYEVIVEEHRGSGKNSRWVTIIHDAGGQPFLLRDSTGKAFVKPDTDHIAIVYDAHFRSGTFNDASPELDAYLSRFGQSSQGWIFNKNIRYREGVLEEGEDVSVLGMAGWEADPDPDPGAAGGGYRDSPRRLVLTSSAELKLHISDDPQATAQA